jgi:hypothetical protein
MASGTSNLIDFLEAWKTEGGGSERKRDDKGGTGYDQPQLFQKIESNLLQQEQSQQQ